MAAQHSGVYIHGDFSEPMSAQHNFSNQYSFDDPQEAMSMYKRIMHQHTKEQLNIATNSARRRSQPTTPSLPTEGSRGSISSSDS
ncbi:hypothetical protein H2201_005239 [Coniosporium apollinis]|uniref:Uncharacterized protein n=2 Tax=Coniosporium TaxID=2810619 RepID=A0ABQ9NQM5_9PEZI|nr:hypothetical protein H2199_006230 [Cladosporium sp. JES 115]KAJ9664490.1 hypothetical protein H2201_005239 [Coniosporium apollinis]